ncbi:MAG: DUF6456 domain-containing protein [Hyphomicrobium sp.]
MMDGTDGRSAAGRDGACTDIKGSADALRLSAAATRQRSTPEVNTPQVNTPQVNDAESPLGWLARRRDKSGRPLIAREEFEAGERLRADFTIAQLTPRITSNWSGAMGGSGGRRGVPGHGVELADHVIAARTRVSHALAAAGPELAGVLIDVCCHLRGLETLEKSAGWPQRSGKIVLQIALRNLARHYGIKVSSAAQEGRGPARLHHWGAADYRPRIDGDGNGA